MFLVIEAAEAEIAAQLHGLDLLLYILNFAAAKSRVEVRFGKTNPIFQSTRTAAQTCDLSGQKMPRRAACADGTASPSRLCMLEQQPDCENHQTDNRKSRDDRHMDQGGYGVLPPVAYLRGILKWRHRYRANLMVAGTITAVPGASITFQI
jgi:hypothetical protein